MSVWVAHSVPLPSELLIAIFDLATSSPSRDLDALCVLRTFAGDHSADDDALCDAPLKTKHALSLTCSLFRQLSMRFLYEDIRIRHGSDGLADALERNSEIRPLVKRISIYYVGFREAGQWCASYLSSTRRILERCPNVLVLTRPHHIAVDTAGAQDDVDLPSLISTDVNLDDVHFPNLRRVDWYNSPIDTLPGTLPTPKFIWHSSSLETLTVGPDHFRPQMDGSPIVDLPNLHTIRVRSPNTPGDSSPGGIDPHLVRLPALRRLILPQPDGVYTLFFQQFLRPCGPRIKTIELAPHPGFLLHDFLSVLLINCSNSTTLNFPAFTTKPTRKNSNLQVVQIIYPVLDVGLSSTTYKKDMEDATAESEQQWARLAGHFLSLFGQKTRFSKLEKLTLYGEEWEAIIADPKFRGFLRILRNTNIEVVCEHESVAATLRIITEGLDFGLTSSR